MSSLFVHVKSTLAAWPSAVAQGACDQASKLTILEFYAGRIAKGLERMPSASLMQKAAGESDTAAREAFCFIEGRCIGTRSAAFLINSNLGNALAADGDVPSRWVNPAFRRSVMRLRDLYIPRPEKGLSLAQQLEKPLRDAIRRYQATPPKTDGRVANESIMLMLIGLQRVASHRGFANYSFRGATPPPRSLLLDVGNIVLFVATVAVVPALVFLRFSALSGAGASLLGLYVGGLVARRLRPPEGKDEVRPERLPLDPKFCVEAA